MVWCGRSSGSPCQGAGSAAGTSMAAAPACHRQRAGGSGRARHGGSEAGGGPESGGAASLEAGARAAGSASSSSCRRRRQGAGAARAAQGDCARSRTKMAEYKTAPPSLRHGPQRAGRCCVPPVLQPAPPAAAARAAGAPAGPGDAVPPAQPRRLQEPARPRGTPERESLRLASKEGAGNKTHALTGTAPPVFLGYFEPQTFP
uniref:ethylene-responsive transcription factor ABI4-like n=1 Tax=Lonchura striata TaxID=40157 RepID=UPI000B4D4D54|nr:ethylene-responsive transcription factor ABI4-like [Lonchura striata domestica]